MSTRYVPTRFGFLSSRFTELPMRKRRQIDLQLYLFERRPRWHEFPPETRRELTRLFSTLCLEIVDQSEGDSETQERPDERAEN